MTFEDKAVIPEVKTGSLEITKVDADTKEKLVGAEFTLSRDGKIIKKGTTNEEGIVKFEDLSFGTYELTEVKAPVGYVLIKQKTKITINEENLNVVLIMENKKTTGSEGTIDSDTPVNPNEPTVDKPNSTTNQLNDSINEESEINNLSTNDSTNEQSETNNLSTIVEKAESLPQTGDVLFRGLIILGILLVVSGGILLLKHSKIYE